LAHPVCEAVAAISSEWWGSGGGVPSGVQGQSPWSGGQRGIAPLKLKKIECFRNNPKLFTLMKHEDAKSEV